MGADTKAILEVVTFAIALLGAVLGIYNAWRNWIQDRARLRVKVSFGRSTSGARVFLIDLVNLSTFPMTVTHIGMDLLGTDEHAQIAIPIFMRGETLPVRLEPRTSVTVTQPMAEAPANGWEVVRSFYALTACGLKFSGGADTLNKYRSTIAAKHHQGAA